MITIVTLLWDPNEHSFPFSLCYDESWADKLYRGWKRNLTRPFRFIVYTDRERQFGEAEIEQKLLKSAASPTYSSALEPYEMNEPMILTGLDTIITGNCDAFVDYCMTAEKPAVPRDPIHTHTVCNGVVLVPGGWKRLYQPGVNDMQVFRDFYAAGEIALLDDVFPGQVKSYRCEVKEKNRDCADNTPGSLGDARVVYMHGRDKMHECMDDKLIQRCWI